MEEVNLMLPSVENDDKKLVVKEESASYEIDKPEPRFAQIEVLENLQATLEEGYDRALVVMATGLGKTYLAGFFAQILKRFYLLPTERKYYSKQKIRFCE